MDTSVVRLFKINSVEMIHYNIIFMFSIPACFFGAFWRAPCPQEVQLDNYFHTIAWSAQFSLSRMIEWFHLHPYRSASRKYAFQLQFVLPIISVPSFFFSFQRTQFVLFVEPTSEMTVVTNAQKKIMNKSCWAFIVTEVLSLKYCHLRVFQFVSNRCRLDCSIRFIHICGIICSRRLSNVVVDLYLSSWQNHVTFLPEMLRNPRINPITLKSCVLIYFRICIMILYETNLHFHIIAFLEFVPLWHKKIMLRDVYLYFTKSIGTWSISYQSLIWDLEMASVEYHWIHI